MKYIFFQVAIVYLFVLSPHFAQAKLWYVGDVLPAIHKACDKNPNGKSCQQACGTIGMTDDKWDVALNEKYKCIELTCGKDDDKDIVRDNIYGQEQRYYTSCGVICAKIGDRHPLCAKEYIKKYCNGNNAQNDKCEKYCKRANNQHEMCQRFIPKKLIAKPVSDSVEAVPPKDDAIDPVIESPESTGGDSEAASNEPETSQVDQPIATIEKQSFLSSVKEFFKSLFKW